MSSWSSPPPTRTAFLTSRAYLAAVTYDKRNQERLKHIQELLERIDVNLGQKKRYRSSSKPRTNNAWKLDDKFFDESGLRNKTSREDAAILNAVKHGGDNETNDWVFNDSEQEYVLSLGGVTVMKLPKVIYDRLKPFQRDAVKWGAGVMPVGGILADDMGLGKTFMAISIMGARMSVKRIQMALVVAPVSVLATWQTEGNKFLSQFTSKVRILKVHGGTAKDRNKMIRNAWKESSLEKPCVVVSSWGLVASKHSCKTFRPPTSHHWDYVVLDEAHLIRNHKNGRWGNIRRICHKNGTSRLLLTGTPFQNDTDELWSIVHMATAGKVLGKNKDFKKEFGKPIKDARCRNASSYDVKRGQKANEQLQEKLKPYFLRRRKMDFLSDELLPKLDTCVWVRASKQQTTMYKEEVQSMASIEIAQDLTSSDNDIAKNARISAFRVIDELRKLCGHPIRLLKGGPEGDILSALQQTDLNTILNGCEKLKLVCHMLTGFKKEGHKTLLFSQSTQNLDIIQYVLAKKGGFSVARLDGSVSEKKRKDTVDLFQLGIIDVFLISTGAGGVGLTLTAASRVILYDPSWNPSSENQAVDRAHRIGQKEEVFVYRLFVAGTIEEKMYEKQVHKTGLGKTIFTIGEKDVPRHFNTHELRKVFAQIPDGSCEILKRFEKEGIAKVPYAHRHELVRAYPGVVGISNHATVYCGKRKGVFSGIDEDGSNKRIAP